MYTYTFFQMYLGNELVTNGDFSSYDLVATYPGPYGSSNAGGNYWLYFDLTIPRCGRYFAVKKTDAHDSNHIFLEITEILLYSKDP